MKKNDNLLFSPFLPIGIILAFGLYFLLFEYEKVPIIRQNILKLEEDRNLLKKFLLHMDAHKQLSLERKEKYEVLKKRQLRNIDPKQLKKELSQMVETSQLQLLGLQIGREKLWGELVGIDIEQTLRGDYQKHLDYLKRIERGNMILVMKNYQLKNLMPSESNPILQAKIELRCFYLKQ